MFDELALDFRNTYREHISIPFIFLGVWIKVADRDRRLRVPLITKDDPRPLESTSKEETVSWGQVDRCNNCGDLIDAHGGELKGYAYEIALKRWETYDNSIFVPGMCNKCREKLYE